MKTKIILIAAVLILGTAVVAYARDIPEGVSIFQAGDHTCVVFPDGSGECFCPCAACQNKSDVPPVSPTEKPPTEVPNEDKEHCNRGIGNGSEGCDPGNSSGQGHGQGRRAGEDRDE